jgi:diguanylate cyclase (GGDEF)-like protein
MYNINNKIEENGKLHIPYIKLVIVLIICTVVSELLTVPFQEYESGGTLTHGLINIVLRIIVTLPVLFIFIITPLLKNRDSLWDLSNTDLLTHIYNRRYFLHVLEHEISRVSRHHRQVSIILFDIDNFKKVNDNYGHEAGDKVLKRVAKVTQERLRNYCTLARYGGEEFIIIIPEASSAETYVIADQIRELIDETKILISTDYRISVTVSLGVAEYHPDIDATIDSLISRADIALYQAKNEGKNRVRVSEIPN